MSDYQHKKTEEKWRRRWTDEGIYEADLENPKKKFYNLMMFPYPSAEGLHVGNMYAFTGADIYGRFKAMQGFEVFEPIGLDGFGIHSENYAIKIGTHPVKQAEASEKRFYDQLSRIGNRFAWKNRLETYDPDYYQWTQWIFTKMFEKGLAYRKKSLVNWCPSCKTVLADEQVEGGKCERCKSETQKKETYQWFFKITDYAQRLLDNIQKIDWPKKIKIAQTNWIGRKEGMEIDWEIFGSKRLKGKKITTFTTRVDTIFGASFLVLSPEHEMVSQLALGKEVVNYVHQALLKTEQQRKKDEKEKTGVPITSYEAIHPLTGKRIPIWVADFVLMDYGTGAVMGVPGHDERDLAFAKKFNLPIIDVVEPQHKVETDCWVGEGKLINSEIYTGMDSRKAREKIADDLENRRMGRRAVNYHLRDWCISRQRYWGPPIPMINCPKCGWVAEKQKNLPVKLPEVKDFKPTGDGRSPLERAAKDWLEVKCPKCGGKARRETDVSDTFLDSSWYFLRYPSIGVKDKVFDKALTQKWLPVDAYIGGAEHAVLHLLYSRFVTMCLKDWGYAKFEEPFPFLYSHGLIIKDGAKMSKSRGNVVIPDEYMEKYGTDSLRMYLMFIGPYNQGGDFRDTGIQGMSRFLGRVWRLMDKDKWRVKDEGGLRQLEHQTIKKVSKAFSKLRYNVGIAALMEYVNGLGKVGMDEEAVRALVLMMAPVAVYMAEEMWQRLGGKFSVHQQEWPKFEEKLAKEEEVVVVVQVNGKVRNQLKVNKKEADDEAKMLKMAKEDKKTKAWIEGKKVLKEVFVKGRLVSLVVR